MSISGNTLLLFPFLSFFPFPSFFLSFYLSFLLSPFLSPFLSHLPLMTDVASQWVAEQVLFQKQSSDSDRSPPAPPGSPTSSALGPNLTSLILFRIRWFVIIPKGSTSCSSWYLRFFPLWKSMMCTTLLVSCWTQSMGTQHEKSWVPANLNSAKALLCWCNSLIFKNYFYLSSLMTKRCIQKRHRISMDFQSKMPAVPKLPFLKFTSHSFIMKRTSKEALYSFQINIL